MGRRKKSPSPRRPYKNECISRTWYEYQQRPIFSILKRSQIFDDQIFDDFERDEYKHEPWSNPQVHDDNNNNSCCNVL